MASFWETVRDRIATDERVFVALVVDHSVHSPGTTGARMTVFCDGSTIGTIGGGIMESNIIRSALDRLEGDGQAPTVSKLYHRKEGPGVKSGLICAGFQVNLYLTLHRDEHLEVLDVIVDAEKGDNPAVLEISPEGLRIDPGVDPGFLRQHHLYQIDDRWVYREAVRNLSRVAVLGGGHCGLALSRLMHQLGYHVSIFDTRPRVATLLENDFTDEKHIVQDFIDAGPMIALPQHTYVVVMTTELTSDVRALLGVASRPFPFVGVMGSRSKISAIRHQLAEEGVERDWIDRLAAPIGLPIGSNTPDEIAVSVAAQLVRVRSDTRVKEGGQQ